jgi:serine/threonine protein kinase
MKQLASQAFTLPPCPDLAMPKEDMVISSSVALANTYEVVVKFTAQYHPEAHRLLAIKGLAPVLHACVPVCGGLFMVVMEHVHGSSEVDWKATNQQKLLPYDVYKDIQDTVALLHSKDLVFGDLRPPNIMVVPGKSGSDAQCRGMLVDFDWVGVHCIGRYPASFDPYLRNQISAGIQQYGIMDKAHDLVMLNKFKDRCHSV